MSRKMDHRIHEIDELRQTRNDATKLRKELRELEKKSAAIEASLLKTMSNSKIGMVNGKAMITIEETERRSITLDTVKTKAPDLFDDLVTVKTSRKVKIHEV